MEDVNQSGIKPELRQSAMRRKDQSYKQEQSDTSGQLQLNRSGFMVHRSIDKATGQKGQVLHSILVVVYQKGSVYNALRHPVFRNATSQ